MASSEEAAMLRGGVRSEVIARGCALMASVCYDCRASRRRVWVREVESQQCARSCRMGCGGLHVAAAECEGADYVCFHAVRGAVGV